MSSRLLELSKRINRILIEAGFVLFALWGVTIGHLTDKTLASMIVLLYAVTSVRTLQLEGAVENEND